MRKFQYMYVMKRSHISEYILHERTFKRLKRHTFMAPARRFYWVGSKHCFTMWMDAGI